MKLYLKLIISVSLLIFIGLGTMGYFVIEQASKNLNIQISKQLAGNLKLGVLKVLDKKNELEKITQLTAQNRYLKKALHLFESRGVSQILNDFISIYPYLNYIVISEPDGTIFSSSTRNHHGQKISGEELLLINIKTNHLFIEPKNAEISISSYGSDRFLSLIGQQNLNDSQLYSAEIIKRGKTIGWVVLSINWQKKYDDLLKAIKLQLFQTDDSVEQVLLIDQFNVIQASSSLNNFTSKIDSKKQIYKPSPNSIWRTHNVIFGDEVLQLLIVANKEKLFAPIKETREAVIYISIISAIILALLLALILQKSIIKRIEKLHLATQLLGDGNLSHRIENLASDELGDLGKSYNKMAQRLQHITTSKINLDKEVEERNIAIKHAQEMTKQAKLANIAKSEFLANMSHEIRTPMNGILGMLGILLNENLNEKQQHYAEIAEFSAKSLLQILNDILDFSKIEAGKLELEYIDFDLHKLLIIIAKEARFQASSKGLEFNLDIAANVPESITTDPGRIRQILLNLTNNAIKFTHKGSVTLSVSVAKVFSHNKIQLDFAIKDTGVGIPIEQHHLLFDSFSQVDASTTRNYGGTGLGLAIVKQLSQLLGGDAKVSSIVGEGSCFSFSIKTTITTPIDRIINTPNSKEYSPEQTATKVFSILLVEDNKVNQIVAETLLEDFGYTTKTVCNGLEALNLLEAGQRYDLILMDCQMPVMDGYEATQKIRASQKVISSNIPIIALTANTMNGDEEKCILSGMNDYIAKPIDPNEMKSVLLRWLK